MPVREGLECCMLQLRRVKNGGEEEMKEGIYWAAS
jgi:hypothetical protein